VVPRPRLAALLSAVLLVLGSGLVAAPATAASTVLCTGYAGCTAAGYSEAGYGAANATMYWRMYAGHNCTNYVAYRMVRSGMANVRPWDGGGNATLWGALNPALTTQVPAVGAVAWWAAYVPPAGSVGHVAYVERVVDANTIIVSQDSWGGDFSWARITRTSGNWPSGFVHFHDAPMTNLARPVVSGTAKVGAVLASTAGSWAPGDATVRYQWRADGVNITGATAPTLTLAQAQQDKKISVVTTASKPGYPTTTVTSATTPAVLPGVISNTAPPTVTGDAVVDSTLVASPGTWTPTPSLLAYQWTADGAAISGAVGPTLPVDPSLVGKALAVTVTASRPGYLDVTSQSTPTAPVAPGTFTVGTPATVTGSPRLGQTLRFEAGTFSPAGSVAVQWVRNGVPVPDATGTSYLLGVDDLGSRIAARMVLTRPGYTTVTERPVRTWTVKSDPRIVVKTAPGTAGKVRVTVTVTAPGVATVTGPVRISWRGSLLTEVTLRSGTATTTLTLPAGTRTFRARYPGSTTVAAGLVDTTTTVR